MDDVPTLFGLPILDGYTDTPTHLRVTSDSGEWFLDGVDDLGHYTEMCWTYDTWQEAMDNVESFVTIAGQVGTPFEWRKRKED